MDYNIIDILMDSELFDDVLFYNNYVGIRDDDFVDLLIAYNEKANKLLFQATVDYLCHSSPLNVYLPSRNYSSYYSKALLSMDSVIINDEIIDALAYIQDYEVNNKIIYMPDNPITHAKIIVSDFIKYISKNRLLISNGSIQIIPSRAREYESNKKRIVLTNQADEHSLWDLIPQNTINIYKKSMDIKPIKRVGQNGGDIYFKELNRKTIAGELAVTISDCNSPYVNGYIFSTARTYKDEHGNIKIIENSRVDSIPESRTTYDNWVAGVRNRTIREHFTNLSLNLSLAKEINSSLGYNCNFTNRILNNINKEGNIKRKMLEVDTPFLTGLSSETIAKIKNDYGDSFDAYKRVLRDTAYKLQLTTDKYHIEMINKEFKERIYDDGIRDIELAITSLRKRSLSELVIESGVAAVGFIDIRFTMWGLISAGIGMTKTIKSIKRDHETVKSHPSYFLLKISKK